MTVIKFIQLLDEYELVDIAKSAEIDVIENDIVVDKKPSVTKTPMIAKSPKARDEFEVSVLELVSVHFDYLIPCLTNQQCVKIFKFLFDCHCLFYTCSLLNQVNVLR